MGKYEIDMASDETDESIEEFTKKVASKSVTVTTTRRSSTSGETFACQSSTICPSTGCGTGSGASDVVITQTVEFTSLSSASDYDGSTLKTVVETAYGISLDIYD